MKRTSYFLRLGCCLLALALLAGCAGPEGKRSSIPAGTQPVGPVVNTAPTEPQSTDPAAEASSGFGLSYYSDGGFNPFTCTKLANRAIMSLMYQRLFVVTSSYELRQDLCKTYTFSDDLRTCTITLNSATFTDGTPVTADDVVASIQAAATLDGSVYGSRFFHMADIEAQDASTVIIYMDTPYEMLPLLLDVPIVRAADVEADRPMGSGPYALRGTGTSLRLERKLTWSGSGTLSQKNIYLRAATSTTEIRDDFEFGNTDISYTDPGSASYVDYRCDYELFDCPTGIMLYLACNSQDGLFSDKRIRSALTYAIDRNSLLSDPYNGFARAATLPADPASPFYDTILAAKYTYAPEKFTAALREKGYAADTTITLLVDGNNTYRMTAAEKIAANLQDAGLSVEIKSLTGSSYYNALVAWNFDLHLGETRLTPNFDLSQFFRPWGSLAFAGMSDGDLYDACLDALENSGNYYNLHQAIMEDGKLCPVLFRTYAVYLNRGSAPGLVPAMDCIFNFSGKSTGSERPAATEPANTTEPESTTEPEEPTSPTEETSEP